MSKKNIWMKWAILTVMCIAWAAHGSAQGPLRMGVGISVGPTLNSPARPVAGADIRLQKSIKNGVSGMLTSGYQQFFKKDSYHPGFGIVPLKAGVKYFPVRNVYLAGEAGAGFGIGNRQDVSFVYSPSFGLAFGDGFDGSIKFEDYIANGKHLPLLALRIAYGFKL